MTDLQFNKTPFYYATYSTATEDSFTQDEETIYTGEKTVSYSNPVLCRANISPARGSATFEQYGLLKNYDKTIVTCDKTLAINELSVLWVDTAPVLDESGATDTPHDYRVVGKAESINSVTYYIKKVDVA